MDGRCSVDAVLDCGAFASPGSVKLCGGTDVYLCCGSAEVHVCCPQLSRLKAVLQFPGPVSDLVVSQDHEHLFASCSSGVYCVSSSFLASRLSNAAGDTANVGIGRECLVVEETEGLCLLLVGSSLLVLSQRDSSWLLTVYKTSKQPNRYKELRTLKLPVLYSFRDDSAAPKRPVLKCVQSRDESSSSSSGDLSYELLIEPVLFKLLFGIDAALTKSQVVLCGLPDGRLCFVPLCVPGAQLQVLHSLEQAVVYFGASDVRPARCLIALGVRGRVLVMTTDTEAEEGLCVGFSDGCLPGPVVCACVHQQRLYYTTGSDLLEVDLPSGPSRTTEQTEKESRKEADGLQSPKSLNVCRVVALAGHPCNTEGKVQLLGLSSRGQLQRLTLPSATGDPGLQTSSSDVGRTVRDLLSAIGDVCERASGLQRSITSKKETLRRLNQVINITFLLNAASEDLPKNQVKPIRCHGKTSWRQCLQEDRLDLTCVLVNGSPFGFERGWTLAMTAFAPGSSPSGHTTSFSFPFSDLGPGEELEVSLPLAAASDVGVPVMVSCSLIFSLSSLLKEEDLRSLPDLKNSCLSLPLNSLTVDWLHTLQVIGAADRSMSSLPHSSRRVDPIQAFIHSQQSRADRRETSAVNERETFSASVQVSTDLLRETILKSSDSFKPASSSVLDWLLVDVPGSAKRGDSSVVQARAHSGDPVKLSAKEVQVAEGGESLATVELRVESSSMAAVCGLHHAVLSKVQTVLQTARQTVTSSRQIQTSCLRRALQRAELLLLKVQQSGTSDACGASPERTSSSVFSVYEELREKPLLII
ncbi:Fanconi anemia core complex-associated protein 100 isoform 1-T1 [Synchiropus picturatus]